MPFASWNDSFSVRVLRLDDEHKRLFSIINLLHAGMKAGHGKDIMQDVLDQLLHYTEEHFRDEEVLMQIVGYPWLIAHTALHQQFVNKIRRFGKEFDSGAAPISVEVLEFLRNWLAEHILRADHQYCAALNTAGIH